MYAQTQTKGTFGNRHDMNDICFIAVQSASHQFNK